MSTLAAPRSFGLLRHSLALARRSVIRTLRTPERLLDVTLQPIMFIVLFVYLFGGAIAGSTKDYLQYVLPALITMGVVFGSMQTGVSLNEDIKKGVFDRFRSLPIGRSAPLIGAVLGDMIRSIVAIAVPIAFGYVIGFRVRTDVLSALAACALMIGFSFCLSWLFVLVAMLVREPGAVQGLSIFALFPLTFGTNMFVPTETLPGWLQAWVEVNPISQVMTAVRGLLVEGPVAEPAMRSVLWGCGLLLVFVPLAVAAYRRRT
jgi:oleandomycin transport system permease protein